MSARQNAAGEHADRLLRHLGPVLLDLSRAADRGDPGLVKACLLSARASITETLNWMEQEVRS